MSECGIISTVGKLSASIFHSYGRYGYVEYLPDKCFLSLMACVPKDCNLIEEIRMKQWIRGPRVKT